MFGMSFGDFAASGSSGGGGSWINWNGLADGTAQLFATDATDIGNAQSIVALDGSRFLLFYEKISNTAIKCVIGTVSGTGVSYGSPLQIETGVGGGPVNASLLTTDTVVVGYGGSFELVIVKTDTDPPTKGSINNFTSASFNNPCSLSLIDTSSFIGIYPSGGDSVAAIGTVSGTTITAHARATVVSGNSLFPAIACYTAGKAVALYTDGSSFPSAKIVNFSGSTIGTIGSAATIESSAIGGDSYGMRVIAIDSSTALAVYSLGATPNIRAVLLSLSGNTVTVNTPVTIKGSTSNLQIATVIQLNATQAMITYGVSSGGTLYGVVINWTGTTIDTVGSEVTVNTASNATFETNQVISKIDANTVASSMYSAGVTKKIGSLIIKRA